MKKIPYIVITNPATDETTIIDRMNFSECDKLKDFLMKNKDCKVNMIFI